MKSTSHYIRESRIHSFTIAGEWADDKTQEFQCSTARGPRRVPVDVTLKQCFSIISRARTRRTCFDSGLGKHNAYRGRRYLTRLDSMQTMATTETRAQHSRRQTNISYSDHDVWSTHDVEIALVSSELRFIWIRGGRHLSTSSDFYNSGLRTRLARTGTSVILDQIKSVYNGELADAGLETLARGDETRQII